MALGSTQPLTENSMRNLPGSKGRPTCKTKNSPWYVSQLSRKCGSLLQGQPNLNYKNKVCQQTPMWRTLTSRMLRRVALVRTDASEECIASIIRLTRIGELGTSSVTSNRSMLWSSFHSHYRETSNVTNTNIIYFLSSSQQTSVCLLVSRLLMILI
jgi:hypothetical protein